MSLKPKSSSPAAVFAAKVTSLESTPAVVANAIKATPGHGVAGRHATRALLDALSGHKDPGMFGRMFPNLDALHVSDAKLEVLANSMKDPDPASQTGNSEIPAGFTYFGQFVDHDITLDLTSLGDKEKDPLGIENFRTPSVDLDCVYGLGPDGSPHLYARNPANGNKHGPKLLIGKNITVGFGGVTGDFRNDLPRSPVKHYYEEGNLPPESDGPRLPIAQRHRTRRSRASVEQFAMSVHPGFRTRPTATAIICPMASAAALASGVFQDSLTWSAVGGQPDLSPPRSRVSWSSRRRTDGIPACL
ncbi:hypothetical protein ACG873_00955 (plasmid) [Mesorhizobium sp. AaZ16]|uniref:hypothetical protein n=1 Tax=Mesorhizobium sp. AaZ16 TaxID=3402289 RepID=UPI00374EB852